MSRKIIRIKFDGNAFFDYKKKSYNNLFNKDLFFLGNHYSFWVSDKNKSTFWRTIEGIPHVDEDILSGKVKMSSLEKVKLMDFKREFTNQLFLIGGDDSLHINQNNFDEINYKQLEKKSLVSWNYKTFFSIYDIEDDIIYIIESLLYKNTQIFNNQMKISQRFPINIAKDKVVLNEKSKSILDYSFIDLLLGEIEDDVIENNKKITSINRIPKKYFKKREDIIIDKAIKERLISPKILKNEKLGKDVIAVYVYLSIYFTRLIKANKNDIINSFLRKKHLLNLFINIKKTILTSITKEEFDSFVNTLILKLKEGAKKSKIQKKDLKTQLYNNLIALKKEVQENNKKGIDKAIKNLLIVKNQFKDKPFILIPYFRNDNIRSIFKCSTPGRAKKYIEDLNIGDIQKGKLIKIIEIIEGKNRYIKHEVSSWRGKCIAFIKKKIEKKHKIQIKKDIKSII